jgi:hypothetical protein
MLRANVFCSCILLATTATFALADDHRGDGGNGQFKANLTGYNEVPAVLTAGSGQVTVAVSPDQTSLDITLNFTQLLDVAQSVSLYLGLPANAGGAVASICGGAKPACPTTPDGTVTLALSASDILAVPAQGLAAGDLTSVIQALSNGAIYINVITTKFPNGEIRGQFGRGFSSGRFGRGD